MTGRKRIMFDVGQPYYLPQFEPVYAVLADRGAECRFVFHRSRDGSDVPRLRSTDLADLPHTVVDAAPAAAGIYAESRPDWVIFGHVFEAIPSMPEDVGRALIYHSVGPKTGRYNDSLNDMHVRFVESRHYLEQIRQRHPGARLELTGYSKLDPVFSDDGWSKAEFLTQRKLDPAAPTVVYAPTYYPSSIELMPNDLPERLADCNLVVKPHFLTLSREKHKKQRAKLARWNAADNVHIATLDEYSLLPFMRAADVLISEQSSALFEFCALDRPIVVCDFYKVRWGYRGILSHRLRGRLDQSITRYRNIGVRVDSPRDLVDGIRGQLANPGEFAEQRRECARQLVGATDGRASERVADYLLNTSLADLL